MKLCELFDDDLVEDSQRGRPTVFTPGYLGRQGTGYGTGWNTDAGGNTQGSKYSERTPPPAPVQQQQMATPVVAMPQQQNQNQQPQSNVKDPPGTGAFPNDETLSIVSQIRGAQITDPNRAKWKAELANRARAGDPNAKLWYNKV